MLIPFFQVDAFTDTVFSGNPAGVCLLNEWLHENTLQAIAEENNLSETAFIVSKPECHDIRWFTPKTEVDLCGHATLAAAFILFEKNPKLKALRFNSRSGELMVRKLGELLQLDFPALPYKLMEDSSDLMTEFNIPSSEVYRSTYDLMCILKNTEAVKKVEPNLTSIAKYAYRGIIVTAPGQQGVDVYSRCFYPACNVPEDPVTGSAHCVITPYWCKKLSQSKIQAKQGLSRQGQLTCEMIGNRVLLSGHCRLYLQGEICY